MHRQKLLRAGSRRAYHPGVGWILGAAKSCMFENLGPEDFLYPVVRTRFRSFSEMHSSIPRMAGASHTTITRRNDGLHPTRASERGRAKGRPDDAWSKIQTDNRVSTKLHIRISIRRYRLPPWIRAILFMPGATSLFAMRFKILLWMLIPGPPWWQARIKTLSHGRVSYH